MPQGGALGNGGAEGHEPGRGRQEVTATAELKSAALLQAMEIEGRWLAESGLAVDVLGELVLLQLGPRAFAGHLAAIGATKGAFAADGVSYGFELRPVDGGGAMFVTGGRTYMMRRAARETAKGNPLGDAQHIPGAAAEIVVTHEPRADWVEYSHPAGTSLRHPPRWKTELSQLGVRLVPEGGNPNDEFVLAFGNTAGGETDPASARAMTAMDALIAGSLPGFTRQGAPAAVNLATGKAAAYDYRGRGVDGRALRCRVLVRIVGGAALGLSHVASAELVDRRRAELESIVDTFGVAAPKAPVGGVGQKAATDDPRLIGVFGGEALAGGGDKGAYVNTQLTYVLNADGTALSGARSSFSASERDPSGNLLWSASGGSGESVIRGTWSAQQGLLTIDWQGQGRTFVLYNFEPDGTLVLRDPTTRKLINYYSRVQ